MSGSSTQRLVCVYRVLCKSEAEAEARYAKFKRHQGYTDDEVVKKVVQQTNKENMWDLLVWEKWAVEKD